MDDLKITINDETIHVKCLMDKHSEYFKSCSIVLYGPTNSGKTTTLKHLMYLLRRSYPIAMVYTPNHEQKHDFKYIIPEPLIYTDIDIDLITGIYNRQREITERYVKFNVIENIRELYESVKSPENDKSLYLIKKHLATDKQKQSDVTVKFMKHVIKTNKKSIIRTDHLKLYKSVFTNPHLLIVFDDASVKLRNILKSSKTGDTIDKFFFEGRHQHVTHVYAVHTTTVFPPQLRGNTNVNIFCHRSCAYSWFENKSNADKYLRDIAKIIINLIFKVKYRILIYHSTRNEFYYLDVKIDLPEYKMCSKETWDFCKPISV